MYLKNNKSKGRGSGCQLWGVVGQGMCPHEGVTYKLTRK